MNYQYRTIEPKLAKYAEEASLLGLKGPIGSGKTTLLVNLFPSHDYINFDDPRTLMRYRQDPNRFLRQLNAKVIFDEVQHAPELIGQLIDHNQPDDRYILVSSCLFTSIRGVDDTQLHKIKMVTLLPYQLIEVPNQLREDSIFRGGFPALISNLYANADVQFTNYIQHNLLKQLPAIGMVSDQHEFQRLLHLLAANTAQPLNMSYYA